jgi:nicotinamidase-related amidase
MRKTDTDPRRKRRERASGEIAAETFMKIDLKRTVILSLDVQNDLVPLTAGVRENRVLDHIARVLAAGRRKRIPVIHVTASVRADALDIPRDNPLWDGLRKSRQLVTGTPGAQIHRKARPRRDELVINKTCVDPFLATNLSQVLHNFDANTLIIVGLWTNYVVEATARHASDIGYRVYVVREACASNTVENHEFAMNRILPTICYVVGVSKVLQTLR